MACPSPSALLLLLLHLVLPTWWSMAALVWLGGGSGWVGEGLPLHSSLRKSSREALPINAALTFDPGRQAGRGGGGAVAPVGRSVCVSGADRRVAVVNVGFARVPPQEVGEKKKLN